MIDGCDGNNPQNPANYKGGGKILTRNNTVTYEVQPQALRQPADLGIQGGCDCTYDLLFNEYNVWGHGWASADLGAAYKSRLGGCALLPDTWSFQYGLGSDGREWTAKFRTGVFQRACAGHAAVSAGAPAGFSYSGTG